MNTTNSKYRHVINAQPYYRITDRPWHDHVFETDQFCRTNMKDNDWRREAWTSYYEFVRDDDAIMFKLRFSI